jgi:predicted ribosomally synthesized peptide with SipW-like signal peptide
LEKGECKRGEKESDAKMNKKILASMMVVGLLALALGWGTYSYFSDTETSLGNTFTAGTLKLDGAGFTSFNLGDIIGNMAPGDLTGYASITIKNTGSLPLVWLGDWVITGGNKLREAIYIDDAKMEFLKPEGTTTWEPDDHFITNGVGSGSYPAWYNSLASLSKFGVVSLDVWDGNNGMGTTPYEHVGALNPNYSYKLTVRFGFAKDAGNEYQGDVTNPVTISFKVDATQAKPDALAKLTSWADWTWINAQLAKQT